jgi:predicted hydrocarbon binding protein
MRRVLMAIQDVMGRSGLMTVLRQARLHRFTSTLPRHDHDLRVQAAEYAGLVQAIEVYYGRGARGTLIRVGEAAFRQLVAHQRLRAMGYRLACLVAPAAACRGLVLRWVAREIARPTGQVEVQALADGRLVLMDHEGDSVFGRTREAPGCWLMVGEVQEALRWATGYDYEVVETHCKALGDPACRYEIMAAQP